MRLESPNPKSNLLFPKYGNSKGGYCGLIGLICDYRRGVQTSALEMLVRWIYIHACGRPSHFSAVRKKEKSKYRLGTRQGVGVGSSKVPYKVSYHFYKCMWSRQDEQTPVLGLLMRIRICILKWIKIPDFGANYSIFPIGINTYFYLLIRILV